jgi:adenine phosphoribosyltransferase
MKNLIRIIPDFPEPGISFKDLNPLFADGVQFHNLVSRMYTEVSSHKPTKVAGIEARGFIIGAALASMLHVGFVPLRKPGKLPPPSIREEYTKEYGKDAMEVNPMLINEKDKILLVDDVLATGETLLAATKLIKKSSAEIIQIAVVAELNYLNGRNLLKEYNLYSHLTFEN